MTKLSICVPTYNRAGLLSETLDSILESAKGYETQIEIIISDNASTDNTGETVRKYLEAYSFISYSRNLENVVDKNFFIVAGLAKGEYIWLFSDDDKMAKEAIGTVLDNINKGFNLIICNFSMWDKEFKKTIKPAFYKAAKDRIFTNFNTLLAEFSIKLQFISSIVMEKKLFDLTQESEYASFHQHGFSYSYAIYSSIRKGFKAILIAKPIVRYRGLNSGFTNSKVWYKVFATGSAAVLRALSKAGYSRRAVSKALNIVLADYIARDILDRKRKREPLENILKPLVADYKYSIYFWFVVVPLIFMPINAADLIVRKLK